MFITLELLNEYGACYEQRQLFEEHFPDGVEVTTEACVAVAAIFDWNWAAEFLLPHKDEDAATYRTALNAFCDADEAASASYHEAVDPLYGIYEETCTRLRDDLPHWSGADREKYMAGKGAAHETYRAGRLLHQKIYSEARAAAFAAAAAMFSTEAPAPAQP